MQQRIEGHKAAFVISKSISLVIVSDMNNFIKKDKCDNFGVFD